MDINISCPPYIASDESETEEYTVSRERKIRVLVVDDSLVFREALFRGISADPGIEVLPGARDPYDARNKILQYAPDVLTCDVEMPGMDGIEFIRRLLPQYPIPVIAVTSRADKAEQAVQAGAVAFITKPHMPSSWQVQAFIRELISLIREAHGTHAYTHAKLTNKGTFSKDRLDPVIAIGASTGGTEAIQYLIHSLPEDMPGIVIVQHIPPIFSRMFAERLNQAGPLKAREAEQGDWVRRGEVLIAPGDHHIAIGKSAGRYKLDCYRGDKVNGHCPSVDVLFESTALAAGSHAIGILLTGMGQDGARGLLGMRKKGARTIGQDESSSAVYGMPKAAFEMGAVEIQAPLAQMKDVLLSLLQRC